MRLGITAVVVLLMAGAYVDADRWRRGQWEEIGYIIAWALVWFVWDFDVIPDWLAMALTAALALGLLFAGDDDDPGGRRRRSAGAAFRRVKSYLARGIPAQRQAQRATQPCDVVRPPPTVSRKSLASLSWRA